MTTVSSLITSASKILLLICLFISASAPAHAESMLSPSYQLRFGNFNMTSGVKSSASYSLTDTVGQTAAAAFTSTGYTIGAGSQYLYQIYEFSFVVSTTSVDFGSLPSGSFANSNLTLTVSAPRQGYTVTTAASTRLKNGTNFIANTTCNAGCNVTTAGVWTNAANYGFGYNMTGNDIATDFIGATYFRPFPDLSSAGVPATIMTTVESGIGRVGTVNLRLSADPTLAEGTYDNHIYYIATPNY